MEYDVLKLICMLIEDIKGFRTTPQLNIHKEMYILYIIFLIFIAMTKMNILVTMTKISKLILKDLNQKL